jgi:hypothetical protein
MNSLFLPILVAYQSVYAPHHRNLTIKSGQYKPHFIKHTVLNYLPIYSFKFRIFSLEFISEIFTVYALFPKQKITIHAYVEQQAKLCLCTS